MDTIGPSRFFVSACDNYVGWEQYTHHNARWKHYSTAITTARAWYRSLSPDSVLSPGCWTGGERDLSHGRPPMSVNDSGLLVRGFLNSFIWQQAIFSQREHLLFLVSYRKLEGRRTLVSYSELLPILTLLMMAG